MESNAQNQRRSPQPLYPHPTNPPQSTNIADFGPIWMKVGVELKNGEQSSKPENFLLSDHLNSPPTPPP